MEEKITYRQMMVETWEREGTRRYEVVQDGKTIGVVERRRCRHWKKHRGIRVNVTASWQWCISGLSRVEFQTRKQAVERMVQRYKQDQAGKEQS